MGVVVVVAATWAIIEAGWVFFVADGLSLSALAFSIATQAMIQAGWVPFMPDGCRCRRCRFISFIFCSFYFSVGYITWTALYNLDCAL